MEPFIFPSPNALTIWMPVGVDQRDYIPAPCLLFLLLLGHHQCNTRAVGLWIDFFFINVVISNSFMDCFNILFPNTIPITYTWYKLYRLLLRRTVFCVWLYIFSCLFMYINIFVQITVLSKCKKRKKNKNISTFSRQCSHLIFNKVIHQYASSGIIISTHSNKYWRVHYTNWFTVPVKLPWAHNCSETQIMILPYCLQTTFLQNGGQHFIPKT